MLRGKELAKPRKLCRVHQCSSQAHKGGWCKRHYGGLIWCPERRKYPAKEPKPKPKPEAKVMLSTEEFAVRTGFRKFWILSKRQF